MSYSEKNNPFSFDRETVAEIVNILSVIESRVSELQKCSSSDFVMLNSYLKKQYNQIETISENVANVYELTAGSENDTLSGRLDRFYDGFKSSVNCAEKEFSDNITLLEKVISDTNLMYIPLKNFVQNVVTLNFLTNSMKFNIVYYDKQNNKLLDGEIDVFRKSILNLKRISSAFEETGLQMKSSSSMIFSGTRNMKERNMDNLQKIHERVRSSKQRLKEKFNQGKTRIPELARKREGYADSISKIITNLQYSDIIRQKIEHIQEAHTDMIEKLGLLEKDDDRTFNLHMLQIKDIADLQVAQLVRTNKEYQNAVEIISGKFAEISNEMNALTKDTFKFSGQTIVSERFHTDFYYIEDFLNEIQILTEDFVEENLDIISESRNIMPQFQTYIDNYQKLLEIDRLVTESTESILKKSEALQDKGYDLSDIIKQIKNVTESTRSNMNNFTKYYQLCEENVKELDFEKSSGDCKETKSFAGQINIIQNETKKNNKIITKILVETESLENKVSNEIKSAITQIQYYDFYEETAAKIITQLKHLYDKIEIDQGVDIQKLKEENLRKSADSYTMKSERITHNSVLFGEDAKLDEDDEEDIEFF